jgi:hypothetical protein
MTRSARSGRERKRHKGQELKRERNVWPDFHHAPDLEASGRAVDFLPTEVASAFCLHGGPAAIVEQLLEVIGGSPVPFEYIVLHPIPNPPAPDHPEHGYAARVAREILPPAPLQAPAPAVDVRSLTPASCYGRNAFQAAVATSAPSSRYASN